jgi:O-antigen chain-terminating methyltransferase
MRMNQPQLEIDDLAAAIRKSMAAHQNDPAPIREASAVSTENSPPQIRLQPDFRPHSNHRYHINELLQYHDGVFVQAAYRAVLKRSPAEVELLRDLNRLRSGYANKIDLLATLRYSPEGKAKKVQLEGLTFPALIRRLGRVPVFGYFIRLTIAFVRLPNLIRDQREFGSYLLSQNEQIADFINRVSARVSEHRREVSRLQETLSKQIETLAGKQRQFEHMANARFGELSQTTEEIRRIKAHANAANETIHGLSGQLQKVFSDLENERTERHHALAQSISEQRELLGAAQNELESKIARLHVQLQHARSELSIQRGSINALKTSDLLEPVTTKQTPIEAHQLDPLYAALEDRFRGNRDEIKERFKVYLPYVKEQAAVVDLGCGRGEWLEVLRAAGIEAHGVDTNRIQIAQCRDRGLDVTEEDFLVHLRSLNDGSVGAITGFHIVEHVALDTLITLLNEALRVLRPKGLVIFETPNPENVLVGSNYFYMDPTHRHPLPSELMEFLLDSRGFQAIEVLNLHSWESAKIPDDNEVTKRFNDYFYGPMDYAIVGRKVGA